MMQHDVEYLDLCQIANCPLLRWSSVVEYGSIFRWFVASQKWEGENDQRAILSEFVAVNITSTLLPKKSRIRNIRLCQEIQEKTMCSASASKDRRRERETERVNGCDILRVCYRDIGLDLCSRQNYSEYDRISSN